MPGPWRRVTELALRRSSDDIPVNALRAAGLSLLNTLGMTVASVPLESGRITRETVHLFFGGSEPQTSARMLSDSLRVSMAGAAYAAVSQTDNLDGHDGYNPTKGHIGVAPVTALAAVVETVDDRQRARGANGAGERLRDCRSGKDHAACHGQRL